MNAVEIEEAVSELITQPFDAAEFPFQFITAFGAKKTTVDRLRRGDSNQSDLGGVLQRNNIHIAIAPAGDVGAALAALRASSRTTTQKAKFILATDGEALEAEDLVGGDVIACAYRDLPRHFATFLPLAGISAVKEIKNNPIDVKATGRINKLYVELLKNNPDWATEERRHELNQFMARLIFCFFAEDTGIFRENQFTATITQISHAGHGSGDERWGNTHEVLAELFRAMDTPVTHEGNIDDRYRSSAHIRPYADIFPYVNGGLFTGVTTCPRFSRTARAFLLNAGALDWKEINPDIFGSMIQAVADDGERGELGMHYTSVPNILKVLNPLFLDGLREQLAAAGDSRQKLRNLRKRLATIRVFDPACGSGNFLVIAYKQMREIEAAIIERLGGEGNLNLDERRSVIPLSNFYGIEIKGFAAEVARLALLIAEFQADCLYLSQREARAMVLPLHRTGQITVGNALRLDWLEVCPPVRADRDESTEVAGSISQLAPAHAEAEYTGTESYICGNPPYVWGNEMSAEQKVSLSAVLSGATKSVGSLDYVAGWFFKARHYLNSSAGRAAFVTTNSINQGRQVGILWPLILSDGFDIFFAHRSLKWSNLASNNAGVTVNIVGISRDETRERHLYVDGVRQSVSAIGPYLVPAATSIVEKRSKPLSDIAEMKFGNMPIDGGHLLLSFSELRAKIEEDSRISQFARPLSGSQEMIYGIPRFCLWLSDADLPDALNVGAIKQAVNGVTASRKASNRIETQKLASSPHRFGFISQRGDERVIAIPAISSEGREYLPLEYYPSGTIITNRNYGMFDAPLFYAAILMSKTHLAWVSTVCGTLELRLSYTNTLGWNTYPVPHLTAQDKAGLTRTAEGILLAREAHFPATIADLYDPTAMPDDLRRAHDENDELLERIYIGRRFRNDTERLEKLFDLYTKMTANQPKAAKGRKATA